MHKYLLIGMLILSVGCSKKRIETDVLDKNLQNKEVVKVDLSEKQEVQKETVKLIEPGVSDVFKTIQFGFDSAILSPEGVTELSRLATYLKDHPGASANFKGHSCQIGTDDYNLSLSDRRFRVCQDFLVDNGINAARISGAGYGEEFPVITIPPEDMDDLINYLSPNRRTEIEVKWKK